MNPILSVKNLSVSFCSSKREETPAVIDASFDLYPGEVVAIVGESGSGKSATAKALLSLFPKESVKLKGSVFFENKDLLTLKEKELRKIRGKEIGMVFQDPMTSLNPTMRIVDQVIEGYKRAYKNISHKEAVEKALTTLEKVGMQNARTKMFDYPNTLSGGMRQRALIATALIPSPKLLIADEPTTALDVTVQASLLDTLSSIRKELGMTILLITHDLSVVAGFCDRVLVMYGGKIVESASTNDLFYKPAHPYTQRLLEAMPKIHEPISSPLLPIDGTPPEGKDLLKGCSFAPRCPKATAACREKVPEFKSLSNTHLVRCPL